MNKEEAKILADVVTTTHGGCPTCAQFLCNSLNKKSSILGYLWYVDEHSDGSFDIKIKVHPNGCITENVH